MSVFFFWSQLNQKLKEHVEGAQNDSLQAVSEPQPVQPTVSITLSTQCICVSCHTLLKYLGLSSQCFKKTPMY